MRKEVLQERILGEIISGLEGFLHYCDSEMAKVISPSIPHNSENVRPLTKNNARKVLEQLGVEQDHLSVTSFRYAQPTLALDNVE